MFSTFTWNKRRAAPVVLERLNYIFTSIKNYLPVTIPVTLYTYVTYIPTPPSSGLTGQQCHYITHVHLMIITGLIRIVLIIEVSKQLLSETSQVK